MQYTYTKVCEPTLLKREIEASTIVTALDTIVVSSTQTVVAFKTTLSTTDESTLDTIVTNHQVSKLTSEPTDVRVSNTTPFADPTYRTKWNAGSAVASVAPDTIETIDFFLAEERYCHGGEIVFDNIKMGDWIEAMIYDVNSVIPLELRSELCENWPVVASYIEKYFVPVGSGKKELSTYPLSAKITAGLSIRIKLHTTTETGTRKLASNFYLTKKLI